MPRLPIAVFEQIETFARYGFNKAHSTCYAYVAYQCAYLKTYYPQEFMAANLTSETDSPDRIYILLEECRRLNIAVLPPDVNESAKAFWVQEGKIRFGMLAVKNVGEGAVEAIIEARNQGGKFVSFADLASRVQSRNLNRRTLESLIAAGALDSLPGNRAQKTEIVEAMLEFGQKVSASAGVVDLFSAGGTEVKAGRAAVSGYSGLDDFEETFKRERNSRFLCIGTSSGSISAGIGGVRDGRYGKNRGGQRRTGGAVRRNNIGHENNE